jgi:hypothetical protein
MGFVNSAPVRHPDLGSSRAARARGSQPVRPPTPHQRQRTPILSPPPNRPSIRNPCSRNRPRRNLSPISRANPSATPVVTYTPRGARSTARTRADRVVNTDTPGRDAPGCSRFPPVSRRILTFCATERGLGFDARSCPRDTADGGLMGSEGAKSLGVSETAETRWLTAVPRLTGRSGPLSPEYRPLLVAREYTHGDR